MARTGYPLTVLHGYEMQRAEALRITEFVITQNQKTLERMADVPKRRAESLPFGALVLDRVLRLCQLERVIISGFGVREGVLFKSLNAQTRALDPLLDAAGDTAERFGRRSERVEELMDLPPGRCLPARRMTRCSGSVAPPACCRTPRGGSIPTARADLSFTYLLQAQIAGIRHRGRSFLALTLWHRYGGGAQDHMIAPIERLVGLEIALRAERLGRALRLGYTLAGSARGLGKLRLELKRDELVLRISRKRADIRGDTVSKRLEELATSFAREPRIALVG